MLCREKEEMRRYIRRNMLVPAGKLETEMPALTINEISHLSRTETSNPGVLNPWAIINGEALHALEEKEPLGLKEDEKGFLPWRSRKRPRHELSKHEYRMFRNTIKKDWVGREQLRELLRYEVTFRNGKYWVNSVWWPENMLCAGFRADAECTGISSFDPMMGPILSDHTGIPASLFLQRTGLWPSVPWECSICRYGKYQ